MPDLRDRLAEFEAAAQRLIARPLVLVHPNPARCHPERRVCARGLCGSCYQAAWLRDQLPDKRALRTRADFVADYELLRSEGYTRRQIADRLRMTYAGVAAAYRRAVAAGDLTPDRRTAA
jgi:hypothetical protein